MYKIRFPLGLRPRPRWGSLQRSSRLLAVFKGPTSKGKRGRRKAGEGGKRKEDERAREGGKVGREG